MAFISASKQTIFLAKYFQRISALCAHFSLFFFIIFLNLDLFRATFQCLQTSQILDFLPVVDKNPNFNFESYFQTYFENIFFIKEVVNLTLFFPFSIQHIIMAREVTKNFMKNLNINYVFFERSIYVILSAIFLSNAFILHQPNDKVLLDFSNPLSNSLFSSLIILHILIELRTFYEMGEADVTGYGLIKIFEKYQGADFPIEFKEKPPSLISSLMRHPLYYCLLVHFWLGSTKITSGRLILNIYLTIFILIGTYCEEREIMRKYPSYKEYIKIVPNKYLPDLTIFLKKNKSE